MNDSLRSLLQKGSETAYEYQCNLCNRDNKNVEATGYCSDCEDCLCQECYNYHLKPKPMRHHILLDRHRMPKNASQRRSKDMCTELCTVHKNETLKFYCAEHGTFVCSVCILQHRNCQSVSYIPDMAVSVLKSKEYKDMTLKVKNLTKTAQQAINTTQKNAQTGNKQHSDASEFFKQFKKNINAAVDKLEILVMKDVGRIRDENQKKTKSVEDQYKQLRKNIVALDSKFTSLENKGQLCQIFFSMKRSHDEIAALETSLLQLQDQSHITEYAIKMNDRLHSLIKQPNNMATLELISVPQKTASQDLESPEPLHKRPKWLSGSSKQFANDRQCVGHEAGREEETNNYKTSVHIADFGIEGDKQRPCITGIVILPGRQLVAVDGDNGTVKMISKKGVSHLKCEQGILDITAVTNTQVAVTNYCSNKILFISVSNKLTLDHKVNVKGQCYGIACFSGDKFVVTYNDKAKVDIISRTGKLVQSVVKKDRGRELFTPPCHVAVSPDQGTIYISDSDRHTVTSLSLNGQVKATYKDRWLEHQQGLTVDRAGVLYVCGFMYNSIHRLSPGFHNIHVQKLEGIVCPQSVAYDDEYNELFIGVWNSNDVEVYTLHKGVIL